MVQPEKPVQQNWYQSLRAAEIVAAASIPFLAGDLMVFPRRFPDDPTLRFANFLILVGRAATPLSVIDAEWFATPNSLLKYPSQPLPMAIRVRAQEWFSVLTFSNLTFCLCHL